MNEVQRKILMLKENGAAIEQVNTNVPPNPQPNANGGRYVTTLTFGNNNGVNNNSNNNNGNNMMATSPLSTSNPAITIAAANPQHHQHPSPGPTIVNVSSRGKSMTPTQIGGNQHHVVGGDTSHWSTGLNDSSYLNHSVSSSNVMLNRSGSRDNTPTRTTYTTGTVSGAGVVGNQPRRPSLLGDDSIFPSQARNGGGGVKWTPISPNMSNNSSSFLSSSHLTDSSPVQNRSSSMDSAHTPQTSSNDGYSNHETNTVSSGRGTSEMDMNSPRIFENGPRAALMAVNVDSKRRAFGHNHPPSSDHHSNNSIHDDNNANPSGDSRRNFGLRQLAKPDDFDRSSQQMYESGSGNQHSSTNGAHLIGHSILYETSNNNNNTNSKINMAPESTSTPIKENGGGLPGAQQPATSVVVNNSSTSSSVYSSRTTTRLSSLTGAGGDSSADNHFSSTITPLHSTGGTTDSNGSTVPQFRTPPTSSSRHQQQLPLSDCNSNSELSRFSSSSNNNNNKNNNSSNHRNLRDDLSQKENINALANTNNSNGSNGPAKHIIVELENRETQTQVLKPDKSAVLPTLVEAGNYKANMQLLIAELDAAKDLNKKLSTDLARCERDLQSIQIQQELFKDKSEAEIATKVANAVRSIRSGVANGYSRSKSDAHLVHEIGGVQSSSPKYPPVRLERAIQTDPLLSNWTALRDPSPSTSDKEELQNLLNDLNRTSLTPEEIAKNCESMLDYVQRKGCKIPSENDSAEQNGSRTAAAADVSKEIERLEKERSDLLDQLEHSKQRENNLQNSKEELQHEITKKNGIVTKIREEIEKLKQERNAVENVRDKLEDENKLLQKQLDTSKSSQSGELSTAKKRIEELSGKINTLQDELNHAMVKLQEEREKSLTLSAELEVITKRKSDEAEKQQKSSSSADKDLQQRLSQLEVEKRELNQQLERELNEKQELFLQINTLLGQVAEAEKRSANAQQDNVNKKHINDLQQEKDKLAKELKQIYDQVHQIQDQSETERSRLQKSLDSIQKENSELSERIAELTQELNREKESTQLAQESMTKLDSLLEEKKNLLAESERLRGQVNEMNDLREERDAIKLQLQEKEQDQAKKASRNEDSAEKLRSMREAKERAESELERFRGRMEQNETKWEHEIYELRNQYTQADEDRFKLQEEIKTLQKKLDEAVSTGSMTNGGKGGEGDDRERADQLESDMKRLEGENKKLKADVDKQQRLIGVLRRKINSQQK